MSDPVSAPVESIIATVLREHWAFSTDTDDYPRFVDRCDGCHEIVFNHGRDGNQNDAYAAHQATAVLSALQEAGTVEWGVQLSDSFMENHHGSRRGAEEVANETGSHVITRVTLPWERAE